MFFLDLLSNGVEVGGEEAALREAAGNNRRNNKEAI
jgi:hypothetical protein